MKCLVCLSCALGCVLVTPSFFTCRTERYKYIFEACSSLCISSIWFLFQDQLLSRSYQDNLLSTDGCRDLHRREARLPHIQVHSDRTLRLYQRSVHSSQVRQDHCRENHAVQNQPRQTQTYLVGQTDRDTQRESWLSWTNLYNRCSLFFLTQLHNSLQSLPLCVCVYVRVSKVLFVKQKALSLIWWWWSQLFFECFVLENLFLFFFYYIFVRYNWYERERERAKVW